MSVKGWPCEAGSPALERYTAIEDSTVALRLKQAGVYLKGLTHMSELGFGICGDTSAKAVSSGTADIAFMTDTMGESRVCSSASGLFGFKPSYGTVSRYGLTGLVASMESYAVVSRCIKNISEAMIIISGCDDKDLSMPDEDPPDFSIDTDVKKSTVGFVGECISALDEDEKFAFTASLDTARKAGVEVVELEFEDFNLMTDVHNVIGSVEASSSAGKYDGVRYGHRAKSDNNWNDMYIRSRAESFGSLLKAYLFQGGYFQYKAYDDFNNACGIRARMIENTKKLFRRTDFIVMPSRRSQVSEEPPLSIGDLYDNFTFTLWANLTGGPAVSVPGLANARNTDIGLQIMGPIRSDGAVLSLASLLTDQVNGKVLN